MVVLHIIISEKNVFGSIGYSDEASTALNLIANYNFDLNALITKRISLKMLSSKDLRS